MAHWFLPGKSLAYGIPELSGALRDAYDGATFGDTTLDFNEFIVQSKAYFKEMSVFVAKRKVELQEAMAKGGSTNIATILLDEL